MSLLDLILIEYPIFYLLAFTRNCVVALILNEYPIFYLLAFSPNYVPCAALPELN